MRIRASHAVVGGALALSALAVPAAQASGSEGDSQITTVVVDGDNMVAIGSSAVTFKVSVTATDDSGIKGADAFHLHGPGDGHATTDEPVCTQADATTSTCTASVTIDPKTDHLTNANAGAWYVDARVDANDGDHGDKEKAGFFHLQRAARLSVTNASPEPVKRGSTVTVTGVISRANWETLKYEGYHSPDVVFQFRRKGGSAYSPLKTVRADAKGNLRATSTASLDGSFRFHFRGASTTSPASGAGDFVDVLGTTASAPADAVKGTPHALDVTFSNTRINGGKNIVVGTSAPEKATVTFTLRHAADVDIHASDFVIGLELYRGNSLDEAIALLADAEPTCTDSPASPATLATCTATVTVDPARLRNEMAGVWKTGIYAIAFNGQNPDAPQDPGEIGLARRDSAKDFPLQRFTKLTADAAPEPVKKGRTITVTGLITRASWDDGKYHGFSSSTSAKLQYRKKTENSYTTLKSTGQVDDGRVKTTTPATYDGYYRLAYPGNWITPDVSSSGDYVDVR
ncbi:hypothetical protein ACGFZB_36645 [Streptomyces cinerochromogenes]|uniref:Calcium-binding protein n=1 Tax=Streptomyces cinerochromogenes TaxID=66422 RepID=A0ABW7BIV6_9ACTN